MYAGWGYMVVVAVLVAVGALLQWRWLARLAAAMLVAASAVLLLFAIYPVDGLRPLAHQMTWEGMGRPFIQSSNRYAAGAMFWAVFAFGIFVLSNTWRAKD